MVQLLYIDRGAVFTAMSGIERENEALPAQPDEAQISSLVFLIVSKARENDSLRCVLHKAHTITVDGHEL